VHKVGAASYAVGSMVVCSMMAFIHSPSYYVLTTASTPRMTSVIDSLLVSFGCNLVLIVSLNSDRQDDSTFIGRQSTRLAV